MNLKSFSIIAALTAIAFSPQAAQANAYRSNSTYLYLPELPAPPGGHIGAALFNYQTIINGRIWQGYFEPPTKTISGNKTTYTTKFEDYPANNMNIRCRGKLVLQRSSIFTNNPMPMTAVWTITGGTNCPTALGDKTTLNLVETLPIANSSGDFTPANSESGFPQGGMSNIWPKWKVVDPTGLNCRATPGGVLVANLPVSTVINTTVFHPNGQWLRRSPNSGPTCYIRANSTYIQPVRLSF
jgi:hypothetical protein